MRTGAFAGLAAVVLLAACAEKTQVATRPPSGYVQDVGAQVAAADWSKARSQTVKLDEFSFAPENLVFERGQPYRLNLENIGQRSHTFTSEGFFKDIAVRRVTTPQSTIETPALVNLDVPAHQTYVVEFVPVAAGTFDLECDKPLHSTFGMTGKITVR
ncbi:MAG TPA: cupredoxin domain-containing protein [Azospirillum sp.]|nr:cupredoxin domain-containing protein [Azospirillum sp.]